MNMTSWSRNQTSWGQPAKLTNKVQRVYRNYEHAEVGPYIVGYVQMYTIDAVSRIFKGTDEYWAD